MIAEASQGQPTEHHTAMLVARELERIGGELSALREDVRDLES